MKESTTNMNEGEFTIGTYSPMEDNGSAKR
jgi:hypothetical protein